MKYHGTIYRPPMEANTFLIPVTEGCTHNNCRFCNMYKGIDFRMLSFADIEKFLQGVRDVYGLHIPNTYLWAAHSLDSTRIAGLLRDKKESMLKALQHSIDTIDDNVFSRTFQRNHL